MKQPRQENLLVADLSIIANASQILEPSEDYSSGIVNHWIKNLDKWMTILSQWKKESNLIGRLVMISVLGRDDENPKLKCLHDDLHLFLENDLNPIEFKLLNMQRNIDLLRRYKINSQEKVEGAKVEMQHLSRSFTELKSKILAELTNTYPATIF